MGERLVTWGHVPGGIGRSRPPSPGSKEAALDHVEHKGLLECSKGQDLNGISGPTGNTGPGLKGNIAAGSQVRREAVERKGERMEGKEWWLISADCTNPSSVSSICLILYLPLKRYPFLQKCQIYVRTFTGICSRCMV